MSKAVTVHIPISPKIAIIVDVKLGFYVKVQGNEKYVSLNLKALIDTGANGSCISRRIAEVCNLKKISFVKIRSIQGESILPVYEADIQLDNDTCFKNCHGIDEDGHVTSSYDIAIMSRELLNNHPSITNYTTIWMDSIRDGKSELVNTNKLVRNYEGCTGLKTGSTSLALYNLSASATRDNLSLITVIMKAPTTALRFSEAKQLLDYGFNNYSSSELSKKDEIIKNITVEKGTQNSINAIFSEDKYCLIPKGQDSKITQEINIPDTISAPINKGDKIGEIKYYYDNELLSSVDVVSDSDVKKHSFINMSELLLKKWFSLLRI